MAANSRLGLTGEGVGAARLGRPHHVSFGVVHDEVGDLVEEHGAEVVPLEEVVRGQPGVLAHVVRQLQRRPALVNVDGEDVIVLLPRQEPPSRQPIHCGTR